MSIHGEDLVRCKDPPHYVGVVVRTWRDDPIPNGFLPFNPLALPPSADPLMQPLQNGQILVTVPGGHLGVGPESNFALLDRNLRPGDIVKRSAEDVQSGVVLKADIKLKLAHTISGVKYPGWVPMEDVLPVYSAGIGTYVVHDNWIGQIVELFDEVFVQLGNGMMTLLAEMGSRLHLGDKGMDILPPETDEDAQNPQASRSDTVVHVQTAALAISWLAINQMLPSSETSNYPRPKRFWSGEEFSQLTALPREAGVTAQLDQKMRFRNPHALESKGVPPTFHSNPSKTITFEVRSMSVKETQSTARVQWQDGSVEYLESQKLVPHVVSDMYECWPGDHVLWKNEGVSRHAIVQSVNAGERTALVLFTDQNATELVSVLELDIAGPNDDQALTEDYGVRVGDFVFLHPEGTTNGLEPPRVPIIGEPDELLHDHMGIDKYGNITGWRWDFQEFGKEIASARMKETSANKKSPVHDYTVPSARETVKSVQWFGEVTKLCLDGLIEVTLSDNTRVTVPLNRLSKLSTDNPDDDDNDSDSDEDGDHDMQSVINGLEAQVQGAGEMWIADDGSAGDEDMEDDAEVWEDINQNLINHIAPIAPSDTRTGLEEPATHGNPVLDATPPALMTPPVVPAFLTNTAIPNPPTAWMPFGPTDGGNVIPPAYARGLLNRLQAELEAGHMNGNLGMDNVEPEPEPEASTSTAAQDDSRWCRFEIQETAPLDHAFLSSKPFQASKTFTTRLQKEFRALASSLPETILVRAYEDRSDLLRCLIIGPENTPYQDAPFVIDWLLESEFPQNPPKAFFHSWTQGHGRVNPNLYEDGKVCLSILGTWGGDHSESWSPRSSLLQAFVSIQGLVLVKEPWYCEPGFEKQKGTPEGELSSRHYSEKAYILSQNFVRRALEQPPGGLESEVRYFYYDKRKLFDLLDRTRSLIAKSSSSGQEEDSDAAVPRLTQGGIISLNRTLPRLQALADDLLPLSS